MLTEAEKDHWYWKEELEFYAREQMNMNTTASERMNTFDSLLSLGMAWEQVEDIAQTAVRLPPQEALELADWLNLLDDRNE